MTLITTPGNAASDSYASLVDALAYHASRGNAAWAAASDTDREPALRRATVWLDASYRDRWPGLRVYRRLQALEWPRSAVFDRDGWAVDYTTIPPEITQATCEAALRELATPGSLSPDYVASQQVAATSAGPVSVTFRDVGGVGAVLPILTVVDAILGRLIMGLARGNAILVRS